MITFLGWFKNSEKLVDTLLHLEKRIGFGSSKSRVSEQGIESASERSSILNTG